jgi:protocatechuate 3,4-dioxygenase beta subunit
VASPANCQGALAQLPASAVIVAAISENQMTRRTAMGAAGAAGVAFLIGGIRPSARGLSDDGVEQAVAATCTMTPAKTVGPYFVDERLNRSDVRETQDGAKLALTMFVFDADNDCTPVEGATVDIWHCNASGLYSDESANGTSGQTWLRGYQTTDSSGKVTFTTIYPGWYSGRAVHIHFKVRVYNGSTETLEFTSQMFFTDDMNTAVFKQAPYSSRTAPDTTDATDNVYGTDGSSLLLAPQSDGAGGYTADFSVGMSRQTSQLNNDSAGGGGTTTTGDTSVDASLSSVKALRTSAGARKLRVKVTSGDAVAVVARLTRNGKTLVKTGSRSLATGTHTFTVTIPGAVKAGAATLRLTFTDAAGNTKTAKRTVHVARRRTSG